MALSIPVRQNVIYSTLVILTAISSIFLYRTLQKEWVIYREAEIKYSGKDYETAIVMYKKSLEAGVPPSKITLNLANSYIATAHFNEAIVLYKDYLLEHPKDNKIRLELARALSYIGNLKESEAEYKKTLEETHENHQIP